MDEAGARVDDEGDLVRGWRGTLWTETCQWFGTVPERESLLQARGSKVLTRVEGSMLKYATCDYL